jgi:hypothetical protein
MEHLDIQTETLFDSSKYEHIERRLEEKYRNDTDSLLTPDKKTQRIFWVCEELNCGHYLNPIGGTAIYSPDLFAQFGIKLSFIKTLPYSYKQQSKTFHNDLSIIDVMMHCGKKGTQELLTKYVLV